MPSLRDLNATFIGQYKPGGSFHEQGELREKAQGLLFDCPLLDGHSIIVWFANSGVPTEASPHFRWAVVGTGIDDLTLQPSINLDVKYTDEKGVQHDPGCRWHGFVINGFAQ